MGLRFRKSITLCKGVRLNVGKTGVSISTGIPGFRKTIHSSGRVTTSIGVPGTGIYYVDTDHIGKKKKQQTKSQGRSAAAFSRTANFNTSTESTVVYPNYGVTNSNPIPKSKAICNNTASVSYPAYTPVTPEIESSPTVVEQDIPVVKPKASCPSCSKLFENCDLPVNWIEVLSNREPMDDNYDPDTWNYLHSKAIDVFAGNVETLLQIVDEVSPFDDLNAYANDFVVEMEDATELGVEFSIAKDIAPRAELQDAVCSVLIRAARDAFALLPVERVVVHVVMDGDVIVAAKLNRDAFAFLEFEGKDPSELLEAFEVNMKFSSLLGFRKVDRFQ